MLKISSRLEVNFPSLSLSLIISSLTPVSHPSAIVSILMQQLLKSCHSRSIKTSLMPCIISHLACEDYIFRAMADFLLPRFWV